MYKEQPDFPAAVKQTIAILEESDTTEGKEQRYLKIEKTNLSHHKRYESHNVRFIETLPPINDKQSDFYSTISHQESSVQIKTAKGKPQGTKYDQIKVQSNKSNKLPDVRLILPSKQVEPAREFASILLESNRETLQQPKSSLFSYDLKQGGISSRKETLPSTNQSTTLFSIQQNSHLQISQQQPRKKVNMNKRINSLGNSNA